MLTDNANVWPSGAPFDWNRNPRRAACPVCGREFEQRSRNQLYCSAECRKRQYRTNGKEREWEANRKRQGHSRH